MFCSFKKLIKISLLLFISIKLVTSLKCLDEDEREVDWWIFYKIPKLNTKGSISGDIYVYITSRTIKIEQNWIYSSRPITNNDSIIAKTLNQIYLSDAQMFNYIQYNDELPINIKSSFSGSSHSAHAKGVVSFDLNEGFWLTHSIPKFPLPLNQHYEYPSTGLHYGQTGLCISFESTESKLNQILNQLLIIRPTVYAHNLDNTLQNEWSKLINKEWSTDNGQTIKLSSLDGVEFLSFSKSPLNEIEIYEDRLALELKESLNVETWRDGSGEHLKSNCSLKYHVYNVESVRINAVDKDLITHDDNLITEQLSKGFFDIHVFDIMKKAAKNLITDNYAFSFKYTVDHSKWAISTNKENPLVCIGDLNRVKSQRKRGGNVMCVFNLELWNIFSKSILSTEPC